MRLQSVQADAVLRRRHPDWQLEPLTSAEPDPLPGELPSVADAEKEQHRSLVAASLAAFRAEMESRTGVFAPSEDSECTPEGAAWPDLSRPHRDAILQPPKPAVPPPRLIQPEVEYQPQA
jgi:hypothetical protein